MLLENENRKEKLQKNVAKIELQIEASKRKIVKYDNQFRELEAEMRFEGKKIKYLDIEWKKYKRELNKIEKLEQIDRDERMSYAEQQQEADEFINNLGK